MWRGRVKDLPVREQMSNFLSIHSSLIERGERGWIWLPRAVEIDLAAAIDELG